MDSIDKTLRILGQILFSILRRVIAAAILLTCLVLSWMPLIFAFTENSTNLSTKTVTDEIAEFYSHWIDLVVECIEVIVFGGTRE